MKFYKKFTATLLTALALTMVWVPVPETQTAHALIEAPAGFTLKSTTTPLTSGTIGSAGLYINTANGDYGAYPKTVSYTDGAGNPVTNSAMRKWDSACNRYLSAPSLGWDRVAQSDGGDKIPTNDQSNDFLSQDGNCTGGRQLDGGSGHWMPIYAYGGWGTTGWSANGATGWGSPTVLSGGFRNINFPTGEDVVWKNNTSNHTDWEFALMGIKNPDGYLAKYGALTSNGTAYFRLEFSFTQAQWDWINQTDSSYDGLSNFKIDAKADDFVVAYLNGDTANPLFTSTQSDPGSIPLNTKTLTTSDIKTRMHKDGNVIAFQVQDKAIWAQAGSSLIDLNRAGLYFNATLTLTDNPATPTCAVAATPADGLAPLVVKAGVSASSVMPSNVTYSYTMGDKDEAGNATPALDGRGTSLYYTYAKASPPAGYNISAKASNGTVCTPKNITVKAPATSTGGEVAP